MPFSGSLTSCLVVIATGDYYVYQVVGALLTHAGAGSEAEADCALEALSSLANTPEAR